MVDISKICRWTSLGSLLSLALFSAGDASADLEIGSGNTATADPTVPRPHTTPCVVSLFDGLTFADFSPKPFSYAPPPGCAGPWAKVVLEVDLSVTAGRQFDRTANIWIGGANVYFGTTAEPSRAVARSWHAERDLTDLSALFGAAQPGEADLGNLVNDTYTGVIEGSARLLFYPAAPHEAAPRAPDVVLPLSAGPTGGIVSLPAGTSRLARTFDLPKNIAHAYLDVIAQSQSGDEFWYTCVPDDVSSELQSCGGGSFRETEVFIDGVPAGIAPVYPWIYTGGIDPYLWRPIPGVETLNFKPYRVDLTPFAGVLSDGKPHEVSVGVYGANNYFATTATLLLELDRRSKQVTGRVTVNTLAADPSPSVVENLTTADGGVVRGTVSTRASRQFVIAGYVDGPHGRVHTEIVQTIDFSNEQTFDISSSRYLQNLVQSTKISSLSSTQGAGGSAQSWTERTWPLKVDFESETHADGSSAQTTHVVQENRGSEIVTGGDFPRALRSFSNAVDTTDTLVFDATGAVVGPQDTRSSQRYFDRDLLGACYSRNLESAGGALTEIADGQGCPR